MNVEEEKNYNILLKQVLVFLEAFNGVPPNTLKHFLAKGLLTLSTFIKSRFYHIFWGSKCVDF